MWPWGHAAVAYLCYALYVRRRYGRSPTALPVLALAIGSQFPDLIDKPLAWNVGVLPGGRTLTHSLLFAAILLAGVYAIAQRVDRTEVAVGFVVGHLSHLAADVPPGTVRGDLSGTSYLLWPILDPPPEEPVAGILHAILTYYETGLYEWAQLLLLVAAIVIWYRDGTPGLELLRRPIGRLETARG